MRPRKEDAEKKKMKLSSRGEKNKSLDVEVPKKS
jgi:hypothetical protein